MKTKHTPGPWTVWNDETGQAIAQVYTVDGNAIAVMASEPSDTLETLANAHLIAAAPEMLAALQGALDRLNRANRRAESRREIGFLTSDVIDAIAKAKGEA